MKKIERSGSKIVVLSTEGVLQVSFKGKEYDKIFHLRYLIIHLQILSENLLVQYFSNQCSRSITGTNEEKLQQIKKLIDKNAMFHNWRTEEIGGNHSVRTFFFGLRSIYRLDPQFKDFHQTSQSLQEKYERIIDEANTARERYKEREKRKRAKKFDFLFQWSAILIALSSLAGMNSFTFTDLIDFGKTFIAVAIIAAIIYLIIPKDNDDEDDDNQSDPTSGPLLIEAPNTLQDLTIISLTEEDSQKSKITNTQSGNTSTP